MLNETTATPVSEQAKPTAPRRKGKPAPPEAAPAKPVELPPAGHTAATH
jgi:hypothetical protein